MTGGLILSVWMKTWGLPEGQYVRSTDSEKQVTGCLFQVLIEFRVDEKVKCRGIKVKRADVTVGLSNTAEVLAVT